MAPPTITLFYAFFHTPFFHTEASHGRTIVMWYSLLKIFFSFLCGTFSVRLFCHLRSSTLSLATSTLAAMIFTNGRGSVLSNGFEARKALLQADDARAALRVVLSVETPVGGDAGNFVGTRSHYCFESGCFCVHSFFRTAHLQDIFVVHSASENPIDDCTVHLESRLRAQPLNMCLFRCITTHTHTCSTSYANMVYLHR